MTRPWCRLAVAACVAFGLSAAWARAAGAAGLPSAFAAGTGFAVASESVIAVPHAGVLRVDELVDGANIGKKAIADLTLPLPPQAAQVQLQQGGAASRFRVAGGRIDLGPVGAGTALRLAFSYEVPEQGGALWLPVGYPTVYLYVMVPQGGWRLSAPGFTPHGSERLGPIVLNAYVTAAPTAGASLPLRFEPTSAVPWRALGLGLAGAAAAALVVAAVARRRRTTDVDGGDAAGALPDG